jgi:hypothetical protein
MDSQSHSLRSETPSITKNVHSSLHYQSDRLVDARLAVLKDLGKSIPEIPFESFLHNLAPKSPSFNRHATMESLKSGSQPAIVRSTNRWSKFPNTPNIATGSEDEIFKPMPEIFTKVVAAIAANLDKNLTNKCTIDFVQNPNRAPTSAERRNESRPDGILVLKDREKEMSKDGKKENIRWADIVLSCEYKRNGGDEDLNDVRIHQGL